MWPMSIVADPAALKAPTIQVQDISLASLYADTIGVLLVLEVYNPNPEKIVVESILYGLSLNHIPVKYGRIRQQEEFPARSMRRVQIPVSLAYDEHLPSILAAMKNPASSTYKIAGSLKLKGESDPLLFYHEGSM